MYINISSFNKIKKVAKVVIIVALAHTENTLNKQKSELEPFYYEIICARAKQRSDRN